MTEIQKEIYNADTYTDAELYNVLDLNNPTDRELEAKILNMIWKYENMQNESGVKMTNFFKQIYNRFFNTEEVEENMNDAIGEVRQEGMINMNDTIGEGMVNMNVANTPVAVPTNTLSSGTVITVPNVNDRTFSYNIPIDYSKDNLNPLLKQTTKRIVVVDSQYRENKSSLSTNFTFNLSSPLKDVVSLKLYSFQIPYTWYTINTNYGSNFFYLKGNTNGILDTSNDIKISIEAGNYTAQTLVSAVNSSLNALQTNPKLLDICFGTTNASYDNINSLSKLSFDIKKIYNEGDYEIYFPYWDSPNSANVLTSKSIPGFLGFNSPYYSPNVVCGIYNKLSGYSIAGLAGAYSPVTNVAAVYQYPTTDNTVNLFYLDASNNYFDINITDLDGLTDVSNGTVYGGIRITLNLEVNTHYTRDELLNELNNQLSVNPFLDNTYSRMNRLFAPLYLYYIDLYTFTQQNLTTPLYMPSPVYPYLYLTQQILNPFYTDSNFIMPKDNPMYPLYIQPTVQPDPTNPLLILPNPFFNPQLLYGNSTPIPQIFPFNKSVINNPFDPNGSLIPNPYDISQNKYINNPYIPLFSTKTISYLYYIDGVTVQSQNLSSPPYSYSPVYPYLNMPKYIPNPFDPSNNITNSNVYYPLYIEPYIQPDQTNNASIIPNPFYNPRLIDISAQIKRDFPFNSTYIPNPFDPNLSMIPNPYDFSGNNYPNLPSGIPSGYMINPYYALVKTESVTYKYYIDSGTFLSYYNEGNGSLNTINSYVYLSTYPWLYLPKFILNPFNVTNVTILQSLTGINYSYWPLYNKQFIQPDPTNPSTILPNPFYNPKIQSPSASFTGPPFPFNTQYIINPFDPNMGYIPNPYWNNYYGDQLFLYDSSGSVVQIPSGYMINPYYGLVSSVNNVYKYYIDSYTFTQKIFAITKSYYTYSISPSSPYLLVPKYIKNPFNNASSIDISYCYLPLYTQPTIQPDPYHPQIILPNPFYNPKIQDSNASFIVRSYPFNNAYIPNLFDPNGGLIPNPYDFSGNYYPDPYAPQGHMINPYYALISSPSINYKFYIDSYTYTQKSLLGQAYTLIPTYPYIYTPQYILNPFKTTIPTNYPYYHLYTQATIQPDPSNNPQIILPNPFYNPKIQNPSASFSGPSYPFSMAYIPNPFDPNGVGIPNPFYASNTSTSITIANGTVITVPVGNMVNPYYGLTAVENITYKFYIDSYTYVQQNLYSSPYNLSPLYPYLYLPANILNPFNTTNRTTLSSGSGSSIPYYSLFIQPTIQPDPIYHPNFLLPNPFYNPKIQNPSASFTGPPYPFNTTYIPNPFDPNGASIENPYDFSGNATMVNPYYTLLTTQLITYKYYLDPYTYGYYTAACQNSTFLATYGVNPASILNYTPTPIYPYEYVPQTILNPFNVSNNITSSYPYWALFTTPRVVPDPTHIDISFNNPFYNPKLLNPYATVSETSFPFNTSYIFNPFDPNGGVISNPYDFSGNSTMVNPYYSLVTAPTVNYKFYLDVYTYTYFTTACQNSQFISAYQVNPANIVNYIYNPVYPFTYAPKIIKNPFSTANLSMGSSYPYWPLFTTPLVAPDPTNLSNTLSNPFYNPQLLGQSSLSSLPYPFSSDPMINPFDPNGGLIPNPLINKNNSVTVNGSVVPVGYMINPYYSLLTDPTIYYKFYIDPYSYIYFTTACETPGFCSAYGINPANITYYTVNPVYPYLYVPATILNPYSSSNTITSSYPYWSLFTTPHVAPDPTNPLYLLDNPYYDPRLLNPSATLAIPSYPFNLDPMPNVFDPRGSLSSFIPNPYFHQNTTTITNPYYALVSTPILYYKFYIDITTCTIYDTLCQTLQITNSYMDKTSPLPIYPYLYVPKIILNPFDPANYAVLAPGAGYPYLPLFILPIITFDPTHPSTTTFYNPFYNPALYEPFYNAYGMSSAALIALILQGGTPLTYPSGPNNTIPNPFNPQFTSGVYIYNPSHYITNYPNIDPSTPVPNGSMVNPYYALFSLTSIDANYVNHATPTTLSSPTNISNNVSFTNPGYNPNVITTSTPTDISLVGNFANLAYNASVITVTSGTISAPSNIVNVNIFDNIGYNPVVNTDNSRGTISSNILSVQTTPNPAYNPNVITVTVGTISVPASLASVKVIPNPGYNPQATISNVPIDISNVTVFPNPGYNPNAIYDISNTLITNVISIPNLGYNPNAIYDISNNDATVFNSFPNIYVNTNTNVNFSSDNQYINQIETVSNQYYNPNISSEFSNPVNNWLGSGFSHYELRIKLNRLTVPLIYSAYLKKTVSQVINQKITVKFPNDYKIWMGNDSAFLFNIPPRNQYPLSLMISESPIYETKVSFRSVPTIQYQCIKKYYDISQNNYIAYINPNIDYRDNVITYTFSEYMTVINNSINRMNTDSINLSNPNGIFKIGANPSYLDETSSSTLFYKNKTNSKLNISTDITKTFGNRDFYLDLGTGNLIKSLGLLTMQVVTGYDASNNRTGPIIYNDVSKNTYENSQYYGGYGLEISGNLWVAVGQGGGNTIVYSTNYGNTWNQGNTKINSLNVNASVIFTERGNKVKYNGNVWVASGKSVTIGNTLAYSSDGINWNGMGNNIFITEAKGVNYSSKGNVWIAVGSGGNTIAYTNPSKNFVNSWSGIVNPLNGYKIGNVYSGIANNVNWDITLNCWVAVGSDGDPLGNTIVTSVYGNSWTVAPSNPFGQGGIGYDVACNGNIWVAVGSSPTSNTCIAYALPQYNGVGILIAGNLNWIPVPTDSLFKYGNPSSVSYNGDYWIVGGNGVDILATSIDGRIWTKEQYSLTNSNNTFVEGINHVQWCKNSNKWIMLGNCGFSGNSIAYGNSFVGSNNITIPIKQPFPSGQIIKTNYNINLNGSNDNSLTLYGSFPINANGYKFFSGNFITLIANPTSANKFAGRELINITQNQADNFSAPDIETLAELINTEFSSFQDVDGDYVLSDSSITFNVIDNNTAEATMKFVVKKYLSQYSYNMILNDPADVSFNTTPTVASWKDPTNTWWNYLKIPYWNYSQYYGDVSGNYYVNNMITNQLLINKSRSIIQNVSTINIRPNQLTVRDTDYTDLSGNYYPVNNKIIIQPQTVLPNPITTGDINTGNPNANNERIPGWRSTNPTDGLFTDNISDSASQYNGYGYNTVIITVPNGDYSTDELITYINLKLNASPYIPKANQLTDPLLTYNQKCITYGSGFTLQTIPGVGNICKMLFNINMIYDTRDFLLDFFNPYGFSICNNVSNNVKSTSWDSTLGWVLGFRNYTEYPLSDIFNASSVVTSGTISGQSLLQIIASNMANQNYTTIEQLQNTFYDPSSQPHIVTLQGDTAVSVNIYNYFLITLDDFNQNHLNDGLITTSKTETDIPLPSYANRALMKCDPTTQHLTVSNINTNSTASDQSVTNIQRNLTQKQIYAAQEIVNTIQSSKLSNSIITPGNIVKTNAKYYTNGPFAQDVFAIVPLKLSGQQNNTIYVDYSGTLQNQERVYFGPVNIHRMSVSLVNDRGETVDLNGANWTFSIVCEQLYQQKKT